MNSRKTLFTILGSVALTTTIGFLLTPYKDSSKRNKIGDKVRDYTDTAEETIKKSVANVKSRVKKWGKMLNE